MILFDRICFSFNALKLPHLLIFLDVTKGLRFCFDSSVFFSLRGVRRFLLSSKVPEISRQNRKCRMIKFNHWFLLHVVFFGFPDRIADQVEYMEALETVCEDRLNSMWWSFMPDVSMFAWWFCFS